MAKFSSRPPPRILGVNVQRDWKIRGCVTETECFLFVHYQQDTASSAIGPDGSSIELMYQKIRSRRNVFKTPCWAPLPVSAPSPTSVSIDIGRQLFVDDYLIAQATLRRTHHKRGSPPTNPGCWNRF
jgi:hypothetical protein